MTINYQLLVRVAELYYQQGLNQNEIAKIIGVSRPSISRLLNEAREKGIVSIHINTPVKKNHDLSDKIRTTFKLRDAIVISSTLDYESSLDLVGKAVADYLLSILKDNIVLGVSWGQGVRNTVNHLPDTKLNNVLVVQLIGSIGAQDQSLDGTELVYRLSKKLDGKYIILNSPAYVTSKQLQETMMEEPQIKEAIEIGKKVDIAVNGIGSLSTQKNTLRRAGSLNDYDIKVLKEKGAVGHIMGRMYNIQGQEVPRDNLFPVACELDILKNAPFSIGCAASEERTEATLGALKGKLINVLICDEDLAEKLLKINK